MKRPSKKSIFIAFSVFLLVAGFLVYKRSAEWNRIRKELESKGETFRLSELFTPRIPDGENFAATPSLKNIRSDRSKRKNLVSIIDWTSPEIDNLDLEKTDIESVTPANLQSYAEYILGNRPAISKNADYQETCIQILDEIERRDTTSILAELDASPPSLDSQFLPSWGEHLPQKLDFPYDTPLNNTSKTLALRATAAIHSGNSQLAAHSLISLLQIDRGWNNEPFLLSALTSTLRRNLTIDALWEGLNTRQFSKDQLTVIQALFEKIDYQTRLLVALRTELAFSINIHSEIDVDLESLALSLGLDPGIFSYFKIWVINDMIVAHSCKWYFNELIYPLEKGFPNLLSKLSTLETSYASAEPILVKAITDRDLSLSTSLMIITIRQVIFSQAFNNLAITTCALERFYLENNIYPNTLSELIPNYIATIPNDPIDDAPLRYIKDPANDRYKIYSIGFDATDNGGATHIGDEENDETRFRSTDYIGDWTWRYPSSKN